MLAVEKDLHIHAPVNQVWLALTDPIAVGHWMGDDTVEIDLQEGGRYTFFNRETSGHFTNIKEPYLIEYTWRQSGWPPDWADSMVRWELTADDNHTHLRLLHSHFPNEDECASHDEGWDSYWLEPMIAWLEA